MILRIGPDIDNNKVRLDFRNSPVKPDSTPSYEIEKSKADEFVKKYNHQEFKLKSLTTFLTTLGGLSGCLMSFRKKSWLWILIATPAGMLAGLCTGAIISSCKKNRLMDKYDVIQTDKQK